MSFLLPWLSKVASAWEPFIYDAIYLQEIKSRDVKWDYYCMVSSKATKKLTAEKAEEMLLDRLIEILLMQVEQEAIAQLSTEPIL